MSTSPIISLAPQLFGNKTAVGKKKSPDRSTGSCELATANTLGLHTARFAITAAQTIRRCQGPRHHHRKIQATCVARHATHSSIAHFGAQAADAKTSVSFGEDHTAGLAGARTAVQLDAHGRSLAACSAQLATM
jgi:hypothetical protein